MRFVLLLDNKLTPHVKCTGQWRCGRTLKDELPNPQWSLANDIRTFPCYRAWQSKGSTR